MRASNVIAAYNEGEFLGQTIGACVETSAGLDHEIIVADNNVTKFVHDDLGRLTQITDATGAVTNQAYDAVGNMTSLTDPDSHSTGTTQVPYVPRLVRIASGSARYNLEDRLGSVVGLTDGSANVTDTFRDDAWGNVLQQQGTTNSAYQ